MSKIKIVPVNSNEDYIVAVVISSETGEKLGDIMKLENGFHFCESERIVYWKIEELEEIINFCKPKDDKLPCVSQEDSDEVLVG